MPTHTDRLFANPAADRAAPYGPAQREALDPDAAADARRAIATWTGYAPTPLHALDRLAADHGLGGISYKDEGPRFGLGSFKALGVGLAVQRVLESVAAADGPRPTVTCASTGNGGLALAWAARRFGCRAVVYVPGGVPYNRRAAIEEHGAELIGVEGDYLAALEPMWAEARADGRAVITDAHPPESGSPIPPALLEGFTTVAAEALGEMGDARPTHLFLQAGTGGFASAFFGHAWQALGPRRPVTVIVEPDAAPCCQASARAGEPVTLPGLGSTAMRGLGCARPTPWGWPILSHADFFLRIPEDAAKPALDALDSYDDGRAPRPADGGVPGGAGGTAPGAAGSAGSDAAGSGTHGRTGPAGAARSRIRTGPTGAAGLAGLLYCAERPALRETLGLGEDSVVLVVGTEGGELATE